MRFKLNIDEYFYDPIKDAERIKLLENLGFKLEEHTVQTMQRHGKTHILTGIVYIEIDSLEELIEFYKQFDERMTLTRNPDETFNVHIGYC